MKKALITGITGQDGAYLAKHLLDNGYEVFGGKRRSSSDNLWRLDYLGITDQVKLVDFDLIEYSNIWSVIEGIQPDELYNLAAQSFVGTSFRQPLLTSDTNALGVMRILDVLKTLKPDTKFYQASTSEMFGEVAEVPQTEATPFHPRSPYGVAKLYAHWATVNYRESYDMFCCAGILFNHESPLRGAEFVTRKVCAHAARRAKDKSTVMEIGNMDSQRDWGYAKEYVEGMHLMLQQDKADDYVLATGETHTIRELIELAYNVVDIQIEWEGEGEKEVGKDKDSGDLLVKVNPKFYRPAEVDLLIGKAEKARKKLNWEAKTKFEGLTELMVQAELERI